MQAEVALARDIKNHLSALMSGLQGCWEDNFGRTIEVSGTWARFNDGTAAWKMEAKREVLWLRGARVIGGSRRQPVWQWRDGVRWVWARPRSCGDGPEEDTAFATIFRQYKSERAGMMRQAWAAIVTEDFRMAAALQTAWREGNLPSEASLMQQACLAAGKYLIPGVCIRHRRTGHHGVIVSCHPCAIGPAASRESSARRPYCHCLMDEREQSGSEFVAFVAEDEIEACPTGFPVLNRLTKRLLIRCDELRGYLPSPTLEEVLKEQRKGESLVIAW